MSDMQRPDHTLLLCGSLAKEKRKLVMQRENALKATHLFLFRVAWAAYILNLSRESRGRGHRQAQRARYRSEQLSEDTQDSQITRQSPGVIASHRQHLRLNMIVLCTRICAPLLHYSDSFGPAVHEGIEIKPRGSAARC